MSSTFLLLRHSYSPAYAPARSLAFGTSLTLLGLRVDADAPPNPLTLGDVVIGEPGASSLSLVRLRVRVGVRVRVRVRIVGLGSG